MSVLVTRAWRDLGRQRGLHLTVAVTVFLGLALYAASYDAFLNLEASYRRTYDRLAFADLVATAGSPDTVAERLAGSPGVEAVTTRRQLDVPIRIGGDHTLLGRMVEIPDGAQPAVDRIEPTTGSLPSPGSSSVVVERHLGEHFGLTPGATVEVHQGQGWHPLPVAGLVVSPEYLWPARSRQDVLTSPDDFGVIFAPTPVFDQVAGPGAEGQVLVRLAAGAPVQRTTELAAAALAAGASAAQPRAEQPSNAALQEDVSGFAELSFLFPMLFLGAAAMGAFILLGRIVRTQRATDAALRANGVRGRAIAAGYLGQGIAVTGAAGAAGLAAGMVLGRLVSGTYTAAIDVPDTVTGFHPVTAVAGLALAMLTGAVAGGGPALAAATAPPAEALKGVVPAGRGGRSPLERLVPGSGRLPARWRMVLRGIGRDRRRAASTTAGVILAVTLVLASWGMLDTVQILLDRQFTVVQRQDAQLYLDPAGDATPVGLAEAVGRIGEVGGIAAAESVLEVAVVASSGGDHYATGLLAFEPGTVMHELGSGPPPGAVLAGRALAGRLGVAPGDTVTLAPIASSAAGTTAGAELESTVTVTLAGFLDEPLGTFLYGDQELARALGTETITPSVMVTFEPGADRAELRRRLTTVPEVVAYRDARSLYDTAQGLMSLFYAFVGVMLLFGAVMAFALIVNNAAITAAERSPELAALEVNGASPGRLARLLAAENLLLTALSIPVGLVVGYVVAASFMSSFSSDLFDFGLELRARTALLTALAVLATAALAQWPVGRALARLDVGRIVRERAR
jgi:putative ABC transport system permease protein